MNLSHELKKNSNPEKAEIYKGFFKTGKGEYGEGDIFLGLTVPQTREIAKKFTHLPLKEIKKHLSSKYHEERMAALFILVKNYQKTKDDKIPQFYIANSKSINNWDLVDLTADKILGNYLFDKDKYLLYNFAKSNNLWERRIAIISTYHFIKNNRFNETLKIAEILLADKHDLIHKAVGWMLREIGKRDLEMLKKFLRQHYKKMPRTMLRYAIEKFPQKERKKYLKGEI